MTTFDQFWAAYPRKIGRIKARTAWDRAMKVATAEAILAGLERVKRGWATKEARFIPHATTWLARGGWEDEEGPRVSREGENAYRQIFGETVLERALRESCERTNVEVSGYYAEDGSAELAAWDAHWRKTRGVNAPRDKRFGYRFPTRWPPT